MSELTQEHFDEVITAFKSHVDDRFETIDTTLADHTARLERLERHIDVSDRLDKIEILLAEQFGRDVLARVGL